MAWFPCNIGGGSPQPSVKTVSYLKWQITKTRSVPAGGYMQIAEFRLYQNAEKYVWNSNVSISSDMTGVSGETIDKLIDDNVNTKFNTQDWGSVQTNECNVIINLGETITLTNTSSYCFVTANDEITRDPVSWKLYGSIDGTNWDLLDERTDADVPTDRERQTFNYPCNIGGGSDSPIETKELIYSIDESQGGVWINSNIDITQFIELYFRYTDSVSGADYTAIVKVEDIAVYTGGADVFTTVFPYAVSVLQFNVRIYNNELYVSFNGVGANTRVVGVYKKITVKGNATVKQGTFVSASSQYGIVDIDCGFKPDMIMVRLPFGNNDTTSYWEKGMSWAETKSMWNLYPAEPVVYVVDLGRQNGETGIQAINDSGFSFMSNGGNTQGITCEYIAVKYEAEPTPVVPFEKEVLHSIVQDQSGSPTPVSVTFTEDYQIAFICGLIADNVRTGAISVNALGGASEIYGLSGNRYASAGIAIRLPSNKTLTGYFPYSDGGAYYDMFGAIGMSRLPSEYEIGATIDVSNISIELSKVYDHIVVFVGMDSTDSNSITFAMNGTSIPLNVESEKFSRYSYHASQELTSDSITLNFTYSGGTVADNTIVVFAYNE